MCSYQTNVRDIPYFDRKRPEDTERTDNPQAEPHSPRTESDSRRDEQCEPVAARSALDAAAIRTRIEQIYADGAMLDARGASRRILPSAVTSERGAFIDEICRAERPAATAEVGFAYGLSTLHILAALAELNSAGDFTPHVVIDPYEASQYGNAGLRALRELGADPMVEFYAEPSEIVLPRIVTNGRRFDLVFIDGDHRFDGGFVDFFFVDRLLKPGGVVIFDDVMFDGIYLTCRWAETNLGYRPVAQFPAAGSRPRRSEAGRLQRAQIGAWRKPLKDVERDRFHFEPFFDGFVRLRDIPKPEPRRVARNRLNHDGLVALQAGDRAGARRAFRAAIRLDPFYRAGYLRWIRTLLPPRLAASLSGRTRGG